MLGREGREERGKQIMRRAMGVEEGEMGWKASITVGEDRDRGRSEEGRRDGRLRKKTKRE